MWNPLFFLLALAQAQPVVQPLASPGLTPAERAALAPQAASPRDAATRSAQPEELRKFCEKAACRHNVAIHLLKKDGSAFDRTIELAPPLAQGGFAMIYPGETARLTPVFKDGKFVEWLPAPDDAGDSTTVVTIKFEQMGDKAGVMAVITKNAGPALKLSLGMVVLDGPEHPLKTSSCPLRAGKWSSYEMWPYPIFTLLAGPPRQLKDDEASNCD